MELYRIDKIYIIILVALLVLSLVGCAMPYNSREVSAEVVEIYAEYVVLADEQGNLWEWGLEEGEVFQLNQLVRIELNNNNTDDIIDDIIVSIEGL